jgi:hypothetical protein
MKFRYKLLSIKNLLVIAWAAVTLIIVVGNKTDFIGFITTTDSIILAAYFAVNHLQDRIRKNSEVKSE